MTKIFAIANQKGGVGKTTTAVNLSASLVALGKKVLLVDLDPQGNATMGSGVEKTEVQHSAFDVLVDRMPIKEAISFSESGGYDVLAANQDLTAAEVQLLNAVARESRLRLALSAEVKQNWDYVLIDCPPSLGMLSLNGLVAAEGLLIPMQCEYFALEGLTDLIDTVKHVTEMVNPDLRIEGILRCMYDTRSSLTQEVSAQLLEFFGDSVYQTTIPRNVRLAEAPSHGKPALAYDKKSRGAEAYLQLAAEIIRRDGGIVPDFEQSDNETGSDTPEASSNP